MMQTTTTAASFTGLEGLWARYQQLPRGRKLIITIFMIWLIQALPKWAVVITADGQTSAQIMRIFITPQTETASALADTDYSYEIVYSHLHSGNAKIVRF